MNPGRRLMTVALTLAVVAVGWAVSAPRPERPRPSLVKPVAVSRPAPATLPPTARDILQGGVLLDLREAQRTRLRALDAEWTRQSVASQAQLDAAMADFARFMDEARASGRTSVQDIQRHSAEIGALSADLRALRRVHAESAAAVLTAWQRGRLDGLTVSRVSGGQR
jgi:hypothetical protein